MQSTSAPDWDMYRQGDESAFERIYFAHVNALYDYGLRMTHDAGLVEDCIQDLFFTLWSKRLQIGAVRAVRPYLLVSLKRKIIRKRLSEQKKSISVSEYPNKIPVFEPDETEGISEETHRCLQQAFATLSDRQREAIYLKFYNQLTYEEIAEVMSVQVKAIYKLMARAILTLRTTIESPELVLALIAIVAS